MNELYPQGSPVTEERVTSARAPRVISRRSYNALLAGLIVLSFAVMGVCSHLTTTADFILFVNRNALAYLVGTLVGTIGGIILMNVGRSKESLGLALTGYALFSLTFGFTTSFALSYYSLESITTAFAATAGIMVVFGLAGIAFPRFFAKIQGILVTSLLAIIVVEIVLSLLGISQSITDIAVILIFCGFIGYDVYRSQADAPTVSNAIWYGVELYLDIINVFMRLLQLFGRRE